MTHLPLFWARSWNNGMRCISFHLSYSAIILRKENIESRFIITGFMRCVHSKSKGVQVFWILCPQIFPLANKASYSIIHDVPGHRMKNGVFGWMAVLKFNSFYKRTPAVDSYRSVGLIYYGKNDQYYVHWHEGPCVNRPSQAHIGGKSKQTVFFASVAEGYRTIYI